MSRTKENVAFVCAHCGASVTALDNGSYRNHCPECLYSLHVDEIPGDRASECLGLMRPIGVDYRAAKGFQLVHECVVCGHVQRNKIAADCTQPDDQRLILELQSLTPEERARRAHKPRTRPTATAK